MRKFKLKQDSYYIGHNHKLYTKESDIIGIPHKDNKMLEVPIMVPCYNTDNTMSTFLDKIPMSILEEVN